MVSIDAETGGDGTSLDLPDTGDSPERALMRGERARYLHEAIRALPDREYLSQDDVWRAIGEATRKFGVGMRNIGTPRDNIGKQATVEADGHVNQP